MAKTQKVQHVHKFKRLKYKSGNVIYFCTQPDCNTKLAPALALGKRTVCWRCNEPFIMNDYSIRLAKPHCEKCHISKSKSEIVEVDAWIGPKSGESILEEIKELIGVLEKDKIEHPLRRVEDLKTTEAGLVGQAEVDNLRSRLNQKIEDEDI